MYLTNTILMVVFVSIVALVSSRFSSSFVLNKIMDFNRQTIEDRGEVLEDKLRQLNDLSDAAVAGDEVIRLMLTEKEQYISPLVMQEIIQNLKIIRDNYTLIDEISLVDYERETVINSQSKLSLGETIYRDAITWNPLSLRSDFRGVSILYTKNWRPVQREADFSIVLEINQEAFQENLFIPFERTYGNMSSQTTEPSSPRRASLRSTRMDGNRSRARNTGMLPRALRPMSTRSTAAGFPWRASGIMPS